MPRGVFRGLGNFARKSPIREDDEALGKFTLLKLDHIQLRQYLHFLQALSFLCWACLLVSAKSGGGLQTGMGWYSGFR